MLKKPPEQIAGVVHFHVVLFRMHERNTASEKALDTVWQTILEHILTHRLARSTKWIAIVTNLRKYILFYKQPIYKLPLLDS